MQTTTPTTSPLTCAARPELTPVLPVEEVELLLRTHLTVVARARLEFAEGAAEETGLVIARPHCDGDQPRAAALAEAARDCAAQLQARPAPRPLRAISVRCGGRWYALWQAGPARLAA